jgi:hypothetical protein
MELRNLFAPPHHQVCYLVCYGEVRGKLAKETEQRNEARGIGKRREIKG